MCWRRGSERCCPGTSSLASCRTNGCGSGRTTPRTRSGSSGARACRASRAHCGSRAGLPFTGCRWRACRSLRSSRRSSERRSTRPCSKRIGPCGRSARNTSGMQPRTRPGVRTCGPHLRRSKRPPPPERDSPQAIDAAFPEAKLRELTANAELKVLRESVRDLMRRERLTRFSRFATWDAERVEVQLLAFVAEVERVDPARMLDLDMRMTKEKLDLLNGRVERVLDACRVSQSTRFQMPRLQRPRGPKL